MSKNLIWWQNGDVEKFDPEAVERELEHLKKPGFYEKHCKSLVAQGCKNCKMLACPF